MFIERAKAVILRVTMCSVRQGGARREVVNPEELRLVCDGIKSTEQKIDLIW